MSKLKLLHEIAIKEDKQVVVCYYSNVGNLIKGVISRFLKNGTIVIQAEGGNTMEVRAIVTNGLAGPANPAAWCLEGSWRKRFAALISSEHVAKLNPQVTALREKFGKLRDEVDGVEFYHIVKWSGLDVDHLAGFVCVNATNTSGPMTGWLVTLDGQTRFVQDVKALGGVEVAPIH